MTLLTEDEAKGKWCPFYRVATSGGDMDTYEMDNRPPDYEENGEGWSPTGQVRAEARCLGPACMAWRWGQKPNPDWKPQTGMSMPNYINPMTEAPMSIEDRSRGFCGLAGRPS
jgi:hypothetical protein